MTGFMGSGKSAIGKRLADRLHIPFRDLDNLIEHAAQQRIPDIFREKGEAHFRKLERDYFTEAVSQSPLVLALGGGAIQQPEIAEYLRENTITVYLDVPLKILFERLRRNQNRPLLHDSDGNLLGDAQLMQRISELLLEREPLYQNAHITVSIQHGWTIDDTTNKLIRLLKQHASSSIPENH